MYTNPIFHSRTKHIAPDDHSTCDYIQNSLLKVSHVSKKRSTSGYTYRTTTTSIFINICGLEISDKTSLPEFKDKE